MKYSLVLTLVLPPILLALPAQSEVYKCRLADGSTEISNSPCRAGSSTVKAVAEDVVPEEIRLKAERNVEQMREQAERLESARRNDEAAEYEQQVKQDKQRQASGPSASQIEECLSNVERIALDSQQRAELEASCRHTGNTPQTVYVPVPYYGGPSYVKPRPPLPTPLPQPKGETNPMPQPTPAKSSSKMNPEYVPPSSFRPR